MCGRAVTAIRTAQVIDHPHDFRGELCSHRLVGQADTDNPVVQHIGYLVLGIAIDLARAEEGIASATVIGKLATVGLGQSLNCDLLGSAETKYVGCRWQ